MGEPMSFVAKRAGASLTIPTGLCLFDDELTDGEQPLIGRLAAGVCPPVGAEIEIMRR